MRPTGGVATVEPVVAHHFTTDRDGRDLGCVAVILISVFGQRPDSRHFTSVATTPFRLHYSTNRRSPESTGLRRQRQGKTKSPIVIGRLVVPPPSDRGANDMRTDRQELPSTMREMAPGPRERLAHFVTAITALVMLGTMVTGNAGASSSSVLILNESSSGRAVTVSPGQHVTLVLHTTYWSVAPLRAPKPLTQVGSAVTAGRLPSAKAGCVAGQGCGTVTVHYVGSAPGVVHLHASRSTCGEALRCSASQSHWTVTIRVR